MERVCFTCVGVIRYTRYSMFISPTHVFSSTTFEFCCVCNPTTSEFGVFYSFLLISSRNTLARLTLCFTHYARVTCHFRQAHIMLQLWILCASIVLVCLMPTRASTNLWRFDQLIRGSYRCGPLTVMKNVLHVRECNGFLMGGGGYIYFAESLIIMFCYLFIVAYHNKIRYVTTYGKSRISSVALKTRGTYSILLLQQQEEQTCAYIHGIYCSCCGATSIASSVCCKEWRIQRSDPPTCEYEYYDQSSSYVHIGRRCVAKSDTYNLWVRVLQSFE